MVALVPRAETFRASHACVGWPLVLATQLALVRTGRLGWHRSLGRVANVPIPLPALFGLAAVISRKMAPIVVSDENLAFMGVRPDLPERARAEHDADT